MDASSVLHPLAMGEASMLRIVDAVPAFGDSNTTG